MQNDNKNLSGPTQQNQSVFTPDQEFRLQSQKIDMAAQLGAGVINLGAGVISLARDLVEIQGIREKGAVQAKLMEEHRTTMLDELKVFRDKHQMGRETFKDDAGLLIALLGELRLQLQQQNLSDEVKIIVIEAYRSMFSEVIKNK